MQDTAGMEAENNRETVGQQEEHRQSPTRDVYSNQCLILNVTVDHERFIYFEMFPVLEIKIVN
jgi:hypothetical protein